MNQKWSNISTGISLGVVIFLPWVIFVLIPNLATSPGDMTYYVGYRL